MPSPPADGFVTGLVLGAGGSTRLGRPKQLLPYGEQHAARAHAATPRARAASTSSSCAIGGAADDVRERSTSAAPTSSSTTPSAAAARRRSPPRSAPSTSAASVLVLMLGDSPASRRRRCEALLAARGDAPLAVCRYDDGRGHPFAFARRMFDELADLHGDKGVWRLLDERAGEVVEVRIAGPVPLDVDTPEDYEAVLAAAGFMEARA